jgi:hypothetical protein
VIEHGVDSDRKRDRAGECQRRNRSHRGVLVRQRDRDRDRGDRPGDRRDAQPDDTVRAGRLRVTIAAVRWTILGIVAGSTLANAGTPSVTRLVMKQTDGTNVHIANHLGSMHYQDDITVGVELQTDIITVVSMGSRRRSDVDARPTPIRVSTDETTWKTRWYGNWQIKGDTLELRLVLSTDDCKREHTETGAAAVQVPCTAAGNLARVTCTTGQIGLESIDGKPPRKVDAWMCGPATAADQLGEGPSGWVLGKTECLERRGGNMTSFVYGTCTASPT